MEKYKTIVEGNSIIHLYPNGDKFWYKNNLLHRENDPAIEYADGSKYWYKNGLLHREGGPAVEWNDGTTFWYKHGKLHRTNGPAIERAYVLAPPKWYIEGENLTEEEFNKRK